MDHDQQLRNLRDFLLVYNRMTEICFQRCTSNMNYRNLTMDEERCVDNCAGKLIRSNHRLMGTYVQLMPRLVQRRMDEMESKAAEATKAGAAEPGAGEALALAASGPKEAEPGTAGPGTPVLTVTEMAPHSLLPAESLSLRPQLVPHGAASNSSLPTPAFEPSVKTASQPAAPS